MTRNHSRLSAVVRLYTFVVGLVLLLRTTFYSTNAKEEKSLKFEPVSVWFALFEIVDKEVCVSILCFLVAREFLVLGFIKNHAILKKMEFWQFLIRCGLV
ncbi:unnamed protein product [Sphagnum jensenii]|uniref:Uncharacterized protein n=1 Tax=Sphagnum jensenii TaxID=128206 RepID=A0ABP1ADS9_9BRYO